MPRPPDEPGDPSGVMVYPKMPVPKGRQSDPGMRTRPVLKDDKKKWIIAIVAGLLFGAIVGFLLRPTHEDEAEEAKKEAVAAKKAATAEKDRADSLQKEVETAKKEKEESEGRVKELSEKAADAEKKIAEADAIKKKLQGAIDKSQGEVSSEGDEIRLKLVDKVLFAVGEADLTDRGKAVLDRVAAAIKDLPDKQVWVQGHTDDTPVMPVVAPKPDPKKAPPKGAKGAKGAKAAPAPAPAADDDAIIKFQSNWELSAARALNVVHYLQDTAKIEPSRLAALAFGQYRPVSKTNKAANRRIEIVLYPRPKLQR